MRTFYSIVCLIAVLILQTSLCDAAPLPQQITGPRLQRNDCVVSEVDAEDSFTSYIQEFVFTDKQAGISLYSCVNWRDGFLKSEGVGKKQSRRAAELVARNNALKTLIVLNLNSSSNLQNYFERQKQISIKVQNVLIKNAEIQDIPADPEKPDEAKVMVTIPFYGIAGLVSFFLDDQEIYLEPSGGTPTDDVPTNQEPEGYTGILVDARDLPTIEPALFPQIVSKQGEILYTASQVDKDILTEQGMVEYVREKQQTTAWRAGEAPLIVKPILLASSVPYLPKTLGVFSNSQSLTLQMFAEAKSQQRRGKRNNLIVKGTDDSGQIPTNVVVSVEDAEKIKQLHQEQQIDKQGNYTILVGREIGGVQGKNLDSILVMQRK
jgi:hypothetical protein